ncbi:hypothetical protein K2X33_04825 [bacterium]|nr:hypothetical protein [bacterium]
MRGWGIALGISLSCAVWAQEPAAEGDGFQAGLKLIEDSKAGKITSVDQLALALPASIFDLGNYGLAFKSKSRHKTDSKKFPRLVGKTKDGNLFVAYATGSEGNENPDFAEFVLSSTTQKKPLFYAVDYSKSPPQVTGPNDDSCTECHGSRLKHNWDNYEHVHGFYGGLADGVGAENTTQEEIDGFKSFSEAFQKNKRTQRLKLPEGDKPLGALWTALADEIGPEVFRRGARQLAAELKESKKLVPFRYALLGAVAGCPDLTGFFPEGRRAVYQTRLKENTVLKRRLVNQAMEVDNGGPVEASAHYKEDAEVPEMAHDTIWLPDRQARIESVLSLAGQSMLDWEAPCKGNGADFRPSIGSFFHSERSVASKAAVPKKLDPKTAETLFENLLLEFGVPLEDATGAQPFYESEPEGSWKYLLADCDGLQKKSLTAQEPPAAGTKGTAAPKPTAPASTKPPHDASLQGTQQKP